MAKESENLIDLEDHRMKTFTRNSAGEKGK